MPVLQRHGSLPGASAAWPQLLQQAVPALAALAACPPALRPALTAPLPCCPSPGDNSLVLSSPTTNYLPALLASPDFRCTFASPPAAGSSAAAAAAPSPPPAGRPTLQLASRQMPLQQLQPRSAAHAALMQGQALATQPRFAWVLLPQPHGAAALPGAPLAGCLPARSVHCAVPTAMLTLTFPHIVPPAAGAAFTPTSAPAATSAGPAAANDLRPNPSEAEADATAGPNSVSKGGRKRSGGTRQARRSGRSRGGSRSGTAALASGVGSPAAGQR